MKNFIVICILITLGLSACSAPTLIQPTPFEPVVNIQTKTLQPTLTNTPAPTATLVPTYRAPKLLLPTIEPTSTATLLPTEQTTGGLIWPRAHFTEANVSWRASSCAQEGRNLSCEIEYRKDNAGCYVGMSCYDACGWYYSVNTIPAGVEEFSSACW
ncbi:MAG: hypothetical protein WDA04_06545 [Anaerolineaceae bacterium]|jgi:hypothetical protein